MLHGGGLQYFVTSLAAHLPITLGIDSITQTTRKTLEAFGSIANVVGIYATFLTGNLSHLLAPTWYEAACASSAVAVTDAAARLLLGNMSTHNAVLYLSLYGLTTADDFKVAAAQLLALILCEL